MTKLDKPLRREIEIGAKRYTLILDPQGLKLKRKGHRQGLDLRWITLVNQIDSGSGTPLAQVV